VGTERACLKVGFELAIRYFNSWLATVRTSATEYSEREQEIYDAGPAVHARTKNIVVLNEPIRPIATQIELREDANRVVH
jgi:hypothetical protein